MKGRDDYEFAHTQAQVKAMRRLIQEWSRLLPVQFLEIASKILEENGGEHGKN